jgi:hypothetical protein
MAFVARLKFHERAINMWHNRQAKIRRLSTTATPHNNLPILQSSRTQLNLFISLIRLIFLFADLITLEKKKGEILHNHHPERRESTLNEEILC